MSEAQVAIAFSRLVNNITNGLDRLDAHDGEVRDAHAAADQARDLGQARAEIAELRLYLATIVSLLIFRKVITPEEFGKISTAIDAADGVADGQFHGEITPGGKVRSGQRAQDTQALRELAAIVRGGK